jgi:hypothetical protein
LILGIPFEYGIAIARLKPMNAQVFAVHPSPAVLKFEDKCLAEIGTPKIGMIDDGMNKASPGKVRETKPCVRKVSFSEACLLQVCQTEVRASKVRSAQVSIAEVRCDFRVRFPPRIPLIDPLFQDCEMLGVGHGVSSPTKTRDLKHGKNKAMRHGNQLARRGKV